MTKNKLLKAVLITLALPSAYVLAKVEPEEQHSKQLRVMSSFLSDHHYQRSALDNKKSREILDNYIELLDSSKTTFTQADIDNFKRFENQFDNFIEDGDATTAFNIYETYTQKRQQQINWAIERLKTPFSDTEEGEFETDKEKINWAKDEAELHKRWNEHLISQWITLRTSKQDDKKARKTLTKRYSSISKHLNESRSDDIFQLFANSITKVYDPHTSYFSPRSSEDFDINMSLSLEGIGASLSIEDEIITIKELIAGGPAMKSGKLARNDKILGVAQGESGAMEDVVGWRLSDTVRLIRGKKGTTIRLHIEKAKSNEIQEILLIRDKIKLEEQAAKSEIKTINRDGVDYRIGIIELPSFYIDFEAANRGDNDFRSTTRDVKKLIKDLQKEGIDGLMIDLRNNGGGSLSEAVSLTGLFFDKGPVVQVIRADGDLTVHRDDDGETAYDGPLALVIDENSASASEIFAGAIKDYGRGVILGEPTYGKGSVQTVIGLNNFMPSVSKPVGQLKMTIAMFYRINGSSTQIKGVKPDIYIPNEASYEPGGESEEDHALPWQKIDPNNYQHEQTVDNVVPQLQADYRKYHATNPMMLNLLDMMTWQKRQTDKTVVSLSFEKRKARRQLLKEESLVFQNNFRALYNYPLLDADYWSKEEKDKTDAEIKAEKEQKIDPVLSIAADTVADYVRLLNITK